MWFNDDDLLKQRNNLKMLSYLVNSANCANDKLSYSNKKKEYKKNINIAKSDYYKNKINNAGNKSKET